MPRRAKPATPPYSENTLWCVPAIRAIVHAVACPTCNAKAGNPCFNLHATQGVEGQKRRPRWVYQGYTHAKRRRLFAHQQKHGLLVPYVEPEPDIIQRHQRIDKERQLEAYASLERELLDAHAAGHSVVEHSLEASAIILAALARKLRRSPSGS